MKKNILTKYLPFVAAVLLATSCGKDDNGGSIVEQPSSTEEVVQPDPNPDPTPDPNPEAPKTVTIPFSVKVNDGASLSKIHYEEKDGKNGKVVSRSFESEDCGNITLDLRSTPGIDDTSDPLELSQDEDGEYVFSGDVTVESEYADDFTNGDMPLTGTFEYSGKKDNVGYSTTSLIDLEENHCDHTFKAEFKSGDEEITFVDQNAYLSVTVYEKQTKFDLTFNGSDTKSFTPDAETHKIWIAVPCGANGKLSVKGALISRIDKDLKPGTVYKVNRTDKYEENGVVFVNLGISDGTWWAEDNVTGGEGTEKDGVWYYDYRQVQTLVESLRITLPTGGKDEKSDINKLRNQCHWEEVLEGGKFKGYNVFKKKNEATYDASKDTHIFIPAVGYCWSNGDLYEMDDHGYLWSSTKMNEDLVYDLVITRYEISPSQDYWYFKMPVREVRRMETFEYNDIFASEKVNEL